jgi:hypothetical protein
MKRWALLSGAVCANVVEQADAPTIGGEWLDVTGLSVGPGSRRVNGAWLPPSPAIPQSVTMRQARLALEGAGKLDDVDAAIAALPLPTRKLAQIEWEYSNEVQRHNGIVSQLGPALGLTEAQIDALFVAAAAL